MRKITLSLLIIVLLLSLFACNNDEIFKPEKLKFTPFSLEAGREAFVDYKDYKELSNIANEVIIGRYEIETIDLDNNIIVYSDYKEISSEYSKVYYIKSLNGQEIVPVISNIDYVDWKIDNNIIILMNSDKKYTVFNNLGERIAVDVQDVDSIKSIGLKHFRIDFTNDRTQVYSINNGAIYNNKSSYPYSSDVIMSLDDKYFIVQTIDGYYNIMNDIGTLIFYYKDTAKEKHRINYLGKDRFMIIVDTNGDVDNYDVKIEDRYLRQDIYIYDAIQDKTYLVNYDYYIFSFGNRYNNPPIATYLNEGYSYMSVYNLNQNKTIKEDYPYIVFVVNGDLIPCIRLQEDVYQYLYFREGKAIENNRREAKIIGLDGNLIWENPNTINIIYSYNDNVMIVGKRIDKEQHKGAYDINGNLIIDFEYEELSAFVNGYAIGYSKKKYYQIDKNGTKTSLNKNIISIGYGIYIVQEGEYQLLYNNKGQLIIGEDMQAREISIYTDRNDKTYALITDMSNNKKVYKVE